jgi:hypothetical protein
MNKLRLNITKRLTAFIAAFVLSVAGVAAIGISSPASAAGGGFTVVNNCGSTQTFGYNYHDAAPGTGAYHEVDAGASYAVNSGNGIWRVELPKGVFNTFVYNNNWNTLTMC